MGYHLSSVVPSNENVKTCHSYFNKFAISLARSLDIEQDRISANNGRKLM